MKTVELRLVVRRTGIAILFLVCGVVSAHADLVLVGSGLAVGTGCGADCANIDIGTIGGFEVSDRQRLAQAFVLKAAVHASSLEVAISAYTRDPTQVNVFLADALGSSASTLAGDSFYLNYPSTPQVITIGTNLDLGPGVYYVLLTSPAGAESDPGGGIIESTAGSLGGGYYATSGLGASPTVGAWNPFDSPTVGFQLIGVQASPVPEPPALLLLASGMFCLYRTRKLISH